MTSARALPSAIRSYLFTPAHDARKVEKVRSFHADAVVLDLEDAVPDSDKVQARDAAQRVTRTESAVPVYVRVNPSYSPLHAEDIRAVVGPSLGGIMLPKVERADDVVAADSLLGVLEEEANLRARQIRLLVLIESALGVANVRKIATSSNRLQALCLGSADLATDLGLPLGSSGRVLLDAVRATLVIESVLARIEPPVDGPHLPLDDSGACPVARRT